MSLRNIHLGKDNLTLPLSPGISPTAGKISLKTKEDLSKCCLIRILKLENCLQDYCKIRIKPKAQLEAATGGVL